MASQKTVLKMRPHLSRTSTWITHSSSTQEFKTPKELTLRAWASILTPFSGTKTPNSTVSSPTSQWQESNQPSLCRIRAPYQPPCLRQSSWMKRTSSWNLQRSSLSMQLPKVLVGKKGVTSVFRKETKSSASDRKAAGWPASERIARKTLVLCP